MVRAAHKKNRRVRQDHNRRYIPPDGPEQTDLVIQMLSAEHLDHVGSKFLVTDERQIGVHESPHAGNECVGKIMIHGEVAHVGVEYPAEQTFRYRVLDAYCQRGIYVVQCPIDDHAQRADIDIAAHGGAGVEKFYLLRGEHLESEMFGLVVAERAPPSWYGATAKITFFLRIGKFLLCLEIFYEN